MNAPIWPDGTANNLDTRIKMALCWSMNPQGRTVVMQFYPAKGWVYETWPRMEIAG